MGKDDAEVTNLKKEINGLIEKFKVFKVSKKWKNNWETFKVN